MKQLGSLALVVLVLISALLGMISWPSAINPREPAFGRSVRVASAVIFSLSIDVSAGGADGAPRVETPQLHASGNGC